MAMSTASCVYMSLEVHRRRLLRKEGSRLERVGHVFVFGNGRDLNDGVT
jgi:hypothetical protein